jgi:two-component system, NarL family, response regulator NreC
MPGSDRERPLPFATDVPLESPQAAGAALAARPYARRRVAPSAEVIRVVVVDDHSVILDALKTMLNAVPDITVVGEAGDGENAFRVTARAAPDVVVMDLDMPKRDGAWATAEIMMITPSPRVLILSMHADEERLVSLLRLGVSGFLSKDADGSELVDAIRTVAAGDLYVRPKAARTLAATIPPPGSATPAKIARGRLTTLGDRERSVLSSGAAAAGASAPRPAR